MSKKIQIVRVDNDLVQKANLQIGNNIIGRGAATGCNDDRVLKHAIIINLSPNDEMTITPMAQCYMKSAGCVRWQSLKLGNSVPIKPGDVCSLLPEKCWFKIISMPDTMEENDQKLKRKSQADEDLNNEADNKRACLSSTVEAVVSPSETLNNILDDKNSSNEEIVPINGNKEHDAIVPVLQEIYSSSSPEGNNVPVTCSKMPVNFPITEPLIEHENGEKLITNVISTSEITMDKSEKKIKSNCDAHFSDQIATASPVESNPRSPAAARRDEARTTNPARVSREKCIYGGRCYRKNPNHKNNYSHPNDSDYDEVDDREECPYGIRCYRKNPQHKAQFKHTAVPRRRRRAATPIHPIVTIDPDSDTDASSVQESVEESVDESDYAPSANTESSDDWDDSGSEWEDGTTG